MFTFQFVLGYWGRPSFNSAIFVAMIAGVITSVIESIGDYYTCARIAGAHPPPAHAVNRGKLGISCLVNFSRNMHYFWLQKKLEQVNRALYTPGHYDNKNENQMSISKSVTFTKKGS